MPMKYELSPQGRLVFYKPIDSDAAVNSIKVFFHPAAFAKMALLVEKQMKEVAWHGLVSRKAPNTYEIDDIIVYPQIVSGANVNTDQNAYQEWLMGLGENFGKVRMQGHSHVNMGTSPSSVDIDHQSKIVAMLEDDMFFIFMIWNKSFDCHIRVYDACSKQVYCDKEVLIDVLSAKSLPMRFTFNKKRADRHISALRRQIAGFYDDAVKLIIDPAPTKRPLLCDNKPARSTSKGAILNSTTNWGQLFIDNFKAERTE